MTYFLPKTDIEIINPNIKRGQIRHALFDFDGTISLIREGWQDVMIQMMVAILLQTPNHESREEITSIVKEYISRLTGRQTIYQMIQFCEEIKKRGGVPSDPVIYKHQYHGLLLTNIQHRLDDLRSGNLTPDNMMVPNARHILREIRAREIQCYLASGTDEVFVVDEANLLGVASFFNGIFGAKDDYKNTSKRIVIQNIFEENNLQGVELISFGDGYVEIEDTKKVGGIAVGVATNEETRSGVNEWKRLRLIEAGADIIIPDFSQYQTLINYLFPE